MTQLGAQPPVAAQPLVADKKPSWFKWLITNEPVLATSFIAAIGVFTNIRWTGASKADLINQITAGLLPIVFGFIARAYVTPQAKLQSPQVLDTVRQQLQSLQTQLDSVLSGNVRRMFDSIIAQAFGAIDPGTQLEVANGGQQVYTPTIQMGGVTVTNPADVAKIQAAVPAPPTLQQVAQTPTEEGEAAGPVSPAGW